jgi:hypothetical protein
MRYCLNALYVGCVATFAALVGCGDHAPSSPPPDGPTSPPPDGPASPPPGGPVTFLRQDTPVTNFVFPATAPDGHASALFVIRNDTDAKLPSIAATIGGDSRFAIDATMSTCVAGPALVPHDLCTVLVRWSAAAADATAQLVVTSGDVSSSLPLRGLVGGSGQVIADTSAIDFGIVPVGSSASADVRLTNTSATDIPTSSIQPGSFSLDDSDCPHSELLEVTFVPANGSCKIRVGFNATAAGWIDDTTMLAGVPVKLDAYGARAVVVVKRGAGTGRIISVPSGIDCGTGCGTQGAYVIGDAMLYEAPDAGSMFAGWRQACGTDPTCAVPERATSAVVATFAGPGSAAITLTITGSATGQLLIGDTPPPTGAFDELTQCNHSCTTYVPVGAPLQIYAVTPSRFDGWTGACGDHDSHCGLQAIAGDVGATATFNKDDRETVTLLPTFAQRVAFAPDGDLLIASHNEVAKLGLDGTVRWSTSDASSGHVADLAVTTAGDIYTYVVNEWNGGALIRRSASGTVGVSSAQGSPSCSFGTSTLPVAPALLASPNGDLGVFTGAVVDGRATNELLVLKPDGAPRFDVDLGPGCTIAAAVGPDGVYQVLTGDQLDTQSTSFHVLRYDASGTPLPGGGPYAIVGGQSVAVDRTGALAFNTGSTIGRILADGTVAFTATTPGGPGVGIGIAYDPAGNVIAATRRGDGSFRLEQWDPTGTPLWNLDKSPDGFFSVFQVANIAINNKGQVAVTGSYAPFPGTEVPWIAVYQMP